MSKVATIFCNTLWLISTLPGWARFRIALLFPKQTQQKNLRRILKNSYIKKGKFHELPSSSYEDILPDIEQIMAGAKSGLTRDPPILLEPTGGSTSGTKLIPYTRTLQKEFQRAIDPWIAGLFFRWPNLLLGRHYWCITPSTSAEQESAVPIGFENDSAYLGPIQQFIARYSLAVPPDINRDTEFNTLLHLLNTPDLRLISVWHPSFLTLMLQTMEPRFQELLNSLESFSPHRAQQLRKIGCNPAKIWKKLKVVSCWESQPWIDQLKIIFPDTIFQPKGLIATEGISSIPLGANINIAAVCSHYYEFECPETGKLLPLWELKKGKTYHLILTTGGGLYRYQTNDLVKVVGFFHRTPRVQFLTRNNMTSDLVGEKITLAHADQICHDLPCKHNFAMIASEKHKNQFRYVLFIETESDISLESYFETQLCRNYQYRHARNTKQLAVPTVTYVSNGERALIEHLRNKGCHSGSIKLKSMYLETDLGSVFRKSY